MCLLDGGRDLAGALQVCKRRIAFQRQKIVGQAQCRLALFYIRHGVVDGDLLVLSPLRHVWRDAEVDLLLATVGEVNGEMECASREGRLLHHESAHGARRAFKQLQAATRTCIAVVDVSLPWIGRLWRTVDDDWLAGRVGLGAPRGLLCACPLVVRLQEDILSICADIDVGCESARLRSVPDAHGDAVLAWLQAIGDFPACGSRPDDGASNALSVDEPLRIVICEARHGTVFDVFGQFEITLEPDKPAIGTSVHRAVPNPFPAPAPVWCEGEVVVFQGEDGMSAACILQRHTRLDEHIWRGEAQFLFACDQLDDGSWELLQLVVVETDGDSR